MDYSMSESIVCRENDPGKQAFDTRAPAIDPACRGAQYQRLERGTGGEAVMHYKKSAAKDFARAAMTGIWGAIPYPFTADGGLDEAGLRSDMRHYVDVLRLDGVFCGGLVGEYWALDMGERMRAQEIVAEEAGDACHVLAHTVCLSLKETIALTRHAQDVGASFVVLANPPTNPRSPDHLFDFFYRLCGETDLGVALFNTGQSGYSLSPELIARIAEIENIICVKDAQPLDHIEATRRLAGDTIVVFDPAEDRLCENIANFGDKGFMSSYVPILFQSAGHCPVRDYANLAWSGDMERARRLSASLEPLRRVEKEWIHAPWIAGLLPIAPLKYWSRLIGLTGGDPRPPLAPLVEAEKQKLRRDLEACGIPRTAAASAA
jgi:4-hydroxy-tetrahydrodipicolinate synthase